MNRAPLPPSTGRFALHRIYVYNGASVRGLPDFRFDSSAAYKRIRSISVYYHALRMFIVPLRGNDTQPLDFTATGILWRDKNNEHVLGMPLVDCADLKVIL